jgi:hypothetical protein
MEIILKKIMAYDAQPSTFALLIGFCYTVGKNKEALWSPFRLFAFI